MPTACGSATIIDVRYRPLPKQVSYKYDDHLNFRKDSRQGSTPMSTDDALGGGIDGKPVDARKTLLATQDRNKEVR